MLTKFALRLAKKDPVFRRRLMASIPPKFLIGYANDCVMANPRRVEEAWELGSESDGGLDEFIQNWSFRVSGADSDRFEKALKEALGPLSAYDLGFDIDTFLDRERIDAKITVTGASYEVDPEDPNSQVEAPSYKHDHTNEIEDFFRVWLKPTRLRVSTPRIRNTRYEGLQEIYWVVKAEWDLSKISLEPPKKLKEAFLRGLRGLPS